MKTRKSAVIALLRQKGTSSSRIWRSARDLDLVAGAVIFGVSARLKNLPSSPSLTQAETSRRRVHEPRYSGCRSFSRLRLRQRAGVTSFRGSRVGPFHERG
jgi:hypothetical protein